MINRLMQNKEKNKFSRVYLKNLFKGTESRSGEGSSLAQTIEIRQQLPKLLAELKVKSLIDAPCGDFHWMKDVKLPVEKYTGIDIVPAMIAINTQKYKRVAAIAIPKLISAKCAMIAASNAAIVIALSRPPSVCGRSY